MDETTRTLDALIAKELKAIEWAAVCDGCPPHELEEFMRQNRDRVMAVRGSSNSGLGSGIGYRVAARVQLLSRGAGGRRFSSFLRPPFFVEGVK